MNQPLRAALYSRVSTDEQAQRGTSLADQHDRTAAYCAENGWAVVSEFVDDAVSGAALDRPALRKLLAEGHLGNFDVVVVTDPDRLSRDLIDGLVVERELDRSEIKVVYLVQPTMGTLERQLRGVIAEEERRKIRDRTSRGLRRVAQAGSWPGGPPPFGFDIVRRPIDPHSHVEINETEATTLRWMIGAFVDMRRTTNDIAAELNHRQTPTPGSSRRLSNPGSGRWTHRRVRDTLKTATGISGTWTYNAATGPIAIQIPPIISEIRHEQLRGRLAETSTGKGATNKKHNYLLTGRITSPCGTNMHGIARPDRAARTYRCSQSTFDRGPDRCECPRVEAESLEAAVWKTTHVMLIDPDRLLGLAGLATADQPDPSENLATLNRKVTRLETALGSTIADLLAGGTNPAAIARATRQLEEQLAHLTEHRDRLRQWSATQTLRTSRAKRLIDLANTAKSTLDRADDHLKQTIINLLDIRVRVTGTILCPTCDGRGLISAPAATHGQGLGRTGEICPTCHRFRRLPQVEIAGAIPDAPSFDHIHNQGNVVPFTLKPDLNRR